MSLKEQIEGLKSQFLPQVPDQIKKVMQKAEDGLRQMRLAERALGTGDEAVDFTLPNVRGEPVSSKALRESGPVVLSFYRVPNAEPLILDSLVDAILPSSKRRDLLPIYSFNGGGLWLTRRQSSDRLRGSDNLSLWRELQQRFTQEAIAAPLPE